MATIINGAHAPKNMEESTGTLAHVAAQGTTYAKAMVSFVPTSR